MCARSEAKLRDRDVSLYMGYFGGRLAVGNNQFDSDKKGITSREEMIAFLAQYEPTELATLLVDLVLESYEG